MAKMSLRLGCWGKSKAVSAIISKISIEGYKSIRKLTLELRAVNVLIGANGAGKSNFVSFFRFLHELIEQRLQIHVATDGGADASLFLGPRETQELKTSLEFGRNGFEFTLLPTVDNRFVFERERSVFYGIGREKGTNDLGSGGGSLSLEIIRMMREWVLHTGPLTMFSMQCPVGWIIISTIRARRPP